VAHVFIRQTGDERLRADVLDLLDRVGLGDRLTGGARVFVKPNLVTDVQSYIDNGANTDVRVIEAVLVYLADHGVRPLLGESDIGPRLKGRKLAHALERMGVTDLQARYDFEIVNLSHETWRRVDFPGGDRITHLDLAARALDVDLVINLPKIKTHKYARITCALKNMYGMIPDPFRVRYHRWLFEVIAHLNSIYDGRMVVLVDGLRAMEGNGPMYGEPVDLGVLLATGDPVAADCTAAALMQIPVAEIEHLGEFVRRYRGGTLVPPEIDDPGLVGALSRPFARPELNCCAEIPAYWAMLIGPLRFLTDACPRTIFHRKRRVRVVASAVWRSAWPNASNGP